MSIREETVESLSDFVARVEQIVVEWTPSDVEWYLQPWFRGHGDIQWKLEPTLYRMPKIRGIGAEYYNELVLLNMFKRRAARYLDHAPHSDWEWLFEMQHHGLPTRLLDWSESYLAALYFAVRDATGETDACVWVVNPWWLGKQVFGKFALPSADDPMVHPWHPGEQLSNLPDATPPIVPVHSNARIQAQRGMFTIHGRLQSWLDTLAERGGKSSCLRRLVIPKDRVVQFRLELSRAGITESVIFPELPGLCKELRTFFFGD